MEAEAERSQVQRQHEQLNLKEKEAGIQLTTTRALASLAQGLRIRINR